MPARVPFMQGQGGINQTNNIAGTQGTGQPMPPPTAGIGPRPPMPMGGGQPQGPQQGPIGASPMGQGQQGMQPGPPQVPPPAQPDIFAGGPTAPMNIESMLQPNQMMKPPGQEQGAKPQGPSLMPWGNEAGMYGAAQQSADAGAQAIGQPPGQGQQTMTDGAAGQMGPQVMIRMLRALGQI